MACFETSSMQESALRVSPSLLFTEARHRVNLRLHSIQDLRQPSLDARRDHARLRGHIDLPSDPIIQARVAASSPEACGSMKTGQESSVLPHRREPAFLRPPPKASTTSLLPRRLQNSIGDGPSPASSVVQMPELFCGSTVGQQKGSKDRFPLKDSAKLDTATDT